MRSIRLGTISRSRRPPTAASHTSDTITGSNWVSAGYGTAGYIMPSGSPVNLTSLRVLPSWLQNYSDNFSGYLFTDTASANRPNKPDNSGTNNFVIAPSVQRTIDFDINPVTGPKSISFYITTDNGAPSNGLLLSIRVLNRTTSTQLVASRTYNNTLGATGISAFGGLVAKFSVNGNIRVEFTPGGTFNVGLLHAIFFD